MRSVVLALLACLLCSPAQASTAPGTLIELRAECGGNVAVEWVVVRNSAYDGHTFFYDMQRPWREIFAGCRVRWMQCVGKSYIPLEGWTLRDGRVLTEHGTIAERQKNDR